MGALTNPSSQLVKVAVSVGAIVLGIRHQPRQISPFSGTLGTVAVTTTIEV